jgi:hypothetical protein
MMEPYQTEMGWVQFDNSGVYATGLASFDCDQHRYMRDFSATASFRLSLSAGCEQLGRSFRTGYVCSSRRTLMAAFESQGRCLQQFFMQCMHWRHNRYMFPLLRAFALYESGERIRRGIVRLPQGIPVGLPCRLRLRAPPWGASPLASSPGTCPGLVERAPHDICLSLNAECRTLPIRAPSGQSHRRVRCSLHKQAHALPINRGFAERNVLHAQPRTETEIQYGNPVDMGCSFDTPFESIAAMPQVSIQDPSPWNNSSNDDAELSSSSIQQRALSRPRVALDHRNRKPEAYLIRACWYRRDWRRAEPRAYALEDTIIYLRCLCSSVSRITPISLAS